MDYKIILFFIAIAFNQGYSQDTNFSIKWGDQFEGSDWSSKNINILSHDNSGTYIYFVNSKTEFTLKHFDSDLKLTGSSNIEIIQENQKCQLERILFLNGKFFIFYLSNDKEGKKITLFFDEIDKRTLQVKGEQRKLHEVNKPDDSNKDWIDVSLQLSPDSTKLLSLYSLLGNKNGLKEYKFDVFDQNIKLIYEKEFTSPINDQLFDVGVARMDNTGNAYFLGVLYAAQKKFSFDFPAYELIEFSEHGKGMKSYNLGRSYGREYKFQMEIVNDALICALGNSESIFYTKFDLISKKLFSTIFNSDPTPQDNNNDTTHYRGHNVKNVIEPGLTNYTINNLLPTKDGGIILLAEQQFFKEVFNTTNPTPTPRHKVYHNDDILVVKIDSSNQVVWGQKFPKTQLSRVPSTSYSSYACAFIDDNIWVIFNDNERNLTHKKEDPPKNCRRRKSELILGMVDVNGNKTIAVTFNPKAVRVIISPKVSKQISKNEVLLFGWRGNKQQLAKLTTK